MNLFGRDIESIACHNICEYNAACLWYDIFSIIIYYYQAVDKQIEYNSQCYSKIVIGYD